jgi:membrane-associated phospholipid phosphatase
VDATAGSGGVLDGAPGERSGLAQRWRGLPRGVPSILFLVGAAVVVLAIWTAIGWLAAKVLGDDFLGRFDRGLSRTLARGRSPDLNDITHYLSYLSETITVIVIGAVVFVSARLAWKRWRESLFVLAVLVGEVSIFVGVTALVDRNRPPVRQLDAAPATSSFPSGHTAAAVALYGAIALLASERVRSRALVWIVVAAAVLIPVAVGGARMYRGMHFLTDVVAGAALGAVWLVISALGIRLGVIHSSLRASAGGEP